MPIDVWVFVFCKVTMVNAPHSFQNCWVLHFRRLELNIVPHPAPDFSSLSLKVLHVLLKLKLSSLAYLMTIHEKTVTKNCGGSSMCP